MIVTTSRNPCQRSRKFCRELQEVIPLSSYVLRGKKGFRELISLSTEKGAERILIVSSKGNGPSSLIFHEQWEFLGELRVSVTLRRELGIPKLPSLTEDIPFLLSSTEEGAEHLAHLFGAHLLGETATDVFTFMTYRKGTIDFFRKDLSETPLGPRIQVVQ